jgi:thioredoxin-dependent peroxiredoxin
MLSENAQFPEFQLVNQAGLPRSNADFLGRWLVVFAYPEDDTPNCTREAKAFTGARESFERANAHVVGLSHNDPSSHQGFCAKHDVKVELLADPEATLIKALGIPQAQWKDSFYWERTTFIVDPKGVIRKVYAKVDPTDHERAVLSELERLQGKS